MNTFLNMRRYLWLFLLFLILESCANLAESTNGSLGAEENWKKIGPGGGGATFIPTFSYASSETFLVRCDMTGAYLTTDGGDSYQQVNFANGASSFAFDPSDPNIIYIGSAVLHRSTDRGKTWEQIFPKPEEVTAEIYESDHANYRIETSNASLYDENFHNVNYIRVDPADDSVIYFSMDQAVYYSVDGGENWSREILTSPVEFIYTNTTTLKDYVHIFTNKALYTFNKDTKIFRERPLPGKMSPAFSFTGGVTKDKEKIIYYALHNQSERESYDSFAQTELWVSQNGGESWQQASHPTLTNEALGTMPSFSKIDASTFEAEQAYVVCDQYLEQNEDGSTAHWYGALKTTNGGESWEWVWKGGGGSGQYGVADGVGTTNLSDAWVEQAFGGEYIRLIDVGVSPIDGNTAIVTDWYRTMKTEDGGKSWNEVYSEAQPNGGFISRGMDVTTSYGVHFDPFDSNHIAISYTDIGYHHSFDGGKSWIRSVEGVPREWRNTCYWVAFDQEVEGKMWSVWSGLHDFPRGKMTRNPGWLSYGRGGVCISTDGGKTWQPATEGMDLNAPSTSIVIDPNSAPGNRTLYVSPYNKGVFKSADDGKTWTLKNQGVDNPIGAFELTIQPDGTLFLVVSATPAHTDGKTGRNIHFGAVYKSVDGAETWEKLNVAKKAGFPNGLAFDPENPARLYLACWADITLSDLIGGKVASETGGNETLDLDGGIFLSEDGGENWQSIFDKDQYVYDVTVDPYHSGRLYCNTFNQAAYRSDDGGKTWSPFKGYDFHWGHRVIVDENDPEQVYLTTFGSSVWHGHPIQE